jgi:signal transduction histidine kinase
VTARTHEGRRDRTRRRLGLRKRLTLIFAVGALTLSTSVVVISYELSRAYLIRQRTTSLEQQTYVSARLLRARVRAGDPEIPALLASLGPGRTSLHYLLDEGQWTTGLDEADPAILPAGLIDVVRQGHAGHQLIRVGGTPRLAIGVPLAESGASYFAVYSLELLNRTLRVLANSLLVAAAITTLLGAIAGWWASRRVLAPLAEVSEAAAAIAGGRLDVRVVADQDPDLAKVATSFNRMTDALQERMQRDARFASAVSHELRSPLATLVSSVEVVGARRHEFERPAREALDLLESEVTHLARLVEDLLEISRIEAGVADLVMEEVRAAEFVTRAVASSVAERISVDLDAVARDAVLRVDKRRLERVVSNLISNAKHHGGGVARVSLEHRDGVVLICVEDDGPGVPADEREQIFEPFVRGRGARHRGVHGGAGLGLSLVAEHVRAHDGHVWVEERTNGGARFVVELPVVT